MLPGIDLEVEGPPERSQPVKRAGAGEGSGKVFGGAALKRVRRNAAARSEKFPGGGLNILFTQVIISCSVRRWPANGSADRCPRRRRPLFAKPPKPPAMPCRWFFGIWSPPGRPGLGRMQALVDAAGPFASVRLRRWAALAVFSAAFRLVAVQERALFIFPSGWKALLLRA